VKPGDRIGLWLKNCPEFVPALFGGLQTGRRRAINNFLKPDEVNFILGDAGIDVVLTDASMSEAFEKLRQARPSLRILLVQDLVKDGALPPAARSVSRGHEEDWQ